MMAGSLKRPLSNLLANLRQKMQLTSRRYWMLSSSFTEKGSYGIVPPSFPFVQKVNNTHSLALNAVKEPPFELRESEAGISRRAGAPRPITAALGCRREGDGPAAGGAPPLAALRIATRV